MTVFSFTSMETLSFFSTFHVNPWLIFSFVFFLHVDYLISSSNLFSVNKNFDVLDYDPLFSDVHCALQFSFSVDIRLLSTENRNISQPVKWDI
jgi:hypothetical protein